MLRFILRFPIFLRYVLHYAYCTLATVTKNANAKYVGSCVVGKHFVTQTAPHTSCAVTRRHFFMKAAIIRDNSDSLLLPFTMFVQA
jgi:hypothetical protein